MENLSRRKVLGGLAGAAVGGLGAGGAEAAEKNMDKGLDIDKQLDEMETAGGKFLAAVQRARELRKKSPELGDVGDLFKTLTEIHDDGAAIEKLTRPFKRK